MQHLPVVDGGVLLGFISEEIILESNDIDKRLGWTSSSSERSVPSAWTRTFYDHPTSSQ